MHSRSDPEPDVHAGAEPSADARADPRAPTRSLLVVAVVACLLLVGLYVLRPFAPPGEPGQHPPESQHQQPGVEASPPVGLKTSLPDPASPPPPKVSAFKREAAEVARRLVDRFPNDPRALDVTAWMHKRFGDPEQAMTCWEQCARMSPHGGGDYYVSMGCAAIETEQYERAVALFRQARARGANPFDVQAGLAEALLNLGRTEQAVATLQQNLTDDLRALPSYVLLGQAYLHLEEYEKAKMNFEHVIQKAPTYSHAYYGLVRACSRLGEEEKCAQYLKKFRSLKTREMDERRAKLGIVRHEDQALQELAAVHRLAAAVCEAQGDVREAEKHWLRAAALNRADTIAREALVRLYREQNRLPETLAQIEQLRQIEPKNLDYARGAGTLYGRLNRFDAAEEALEQVLQQSPEECWGYLALCRLYLQSDRKIPEAAKLAEKAVRLDPAASTYFLLSAAHERNGDLPGALTAIQQALKLDPRNPQYQRAERMIREKL